MSGCSSEVYASARARVRGMSGEDTRGMCLLARYLQQRYFYSAPPSGLRRFSQIHGRFQPHSKNGPMRAQKKVRGIGAPPSGFRRFSQIHGRFQPHSENGPVWARKRRAASGHCSCVRRGACDTRFPTCPCRTFLSSPAVVRTCGRGIIPGNWNIMVLTRGGHPPPPPGAGGKKQTCPA